MTIRLYHQDSYLAKAEAAVVRHDKVGDTLRLVLDRTIFCPRGGGQPEDHGTINGVAVLELAEENGEIVHVLGEDPGPPPMRLAIDFVRRYDHMQQHTAQHLLSQHLQREMGISTLSFAIGPDHASIELGVESLSDSQLDAIEEACCSIVCRNLPLRVFETDDPSTVPLRKPPKKEGLLRIVEIADFDFSSCGGTHVRTTGELGLIKIVRSDRVRGNLRIYYLAGMRALRDYQGKQRVLFAVQQKITVPLEQIPLAVERLVAEREQLGRELKTLRRQELDREVATLAASPEPLVVRSFEGESIDEMKYFTASLLKAGKHVLAYSPTLRYLQIGRGSGSVDLKALASEIFLLLAGKGGGRDSLLEGQATDFSNLERVVDLLKRAFSQ